MGQFFSKPSGNSLDSHTFENLTPAIDDEHRTAVTHVIVVPSTNKSYDPLSIKSARFIGVLEDGKTTSMACLLQDGSVLTSLHSIFDFETNKYFGRRDMTVTFVHQDKLYTALLKFEWVNAFHWLKTVRKYSHRLDNMSINNGHGKFVFSSTWY